MRKIFFTVIFLVGSYAGAEGAIGTEQLPDSASQMDSSAFKMPEAKEDKPKRNGFVSSTFGVVSGDLDNFVLDIETSYGEVVGKTEIADAGTFEASTSVSGTFAAGGSILLVSGSTEINFIKNDGINTLVPGLGVNVAVGYVDAGTATGYITSLGGELYLKAFVSKQFALVPYFSLAYAQGGVSDYDLSGLRASGVGFSLGVGLRRYF